MLTAYDQYAAAIFDQAGIPVLLVGDSAANNVLGYENTVPVTVDELVPFVRAVVGATSRALVVADFPFGSYEASPQQALETGVRFLKEGGAQAVKMEGGHRVAPQVEALVSAGIPVMGHIGLTPQSVNVLGGYRVQGRGEAGEQLIRDAKELEHAGAFAVVLEVVPAELARRVTETLTIPTIGIGAGNGTDAQVLVWPDLLGLNPKPPKFVQAVRGPALGDDRRGAAVGRRRGQRRLPRRRPLLQLSRRAGPPRRHGQRPRRAGARAGRAPRPARGRTRSGAGPRPARPQSRGTPPVRRRR